MRDVSNAELADWLERVPGSSALPEKRRLSRLAAQRLRQTVTTPESSLQHQIDDLKRRVAALEAAIEGRALCS